MLHLLNIAPPASPAIPTAQYIRNIQPLTFFEKYTAQLENIVVVYGPKLVAGFVFLFLGWWIIRIIVKGLGRIMEARDIDPTLRPFLKSLLSISLKVMLILSVASQIGIQTTSFVAALGAAGLAIGLALQGSLANFAGGILILAFKPFKVGDFIGTQKYDGTVIEIQILYTILNTSDNKKVIIPNGVLSNNEVVNFTANDNRRIDTKISIGYSSDLLKAKEILTELLASNELILKDPAPIVGVGELTDNAMVFNIWAWVKRADYIAVKYNIHEMAKIKFDAAGIKLPWSELEPVFGKTNP
jgi:small conductance mechanosensitive channel